jgi:hypothetical protein
MLADKCYRYRAPDRIKMLPKISGYSALLWESCLLKSEIIGPLCNFTDKSKLEQNALLRAQAGIGRK